MTLKSTLKRKSRSKNL